MNEDPFANQAAAELAFAKSMGWDDWTWAEESEEGMVKRPRNSRGNRPWAARRKQESDELRQFGLATPTPLPPIRHTGFTFHDQRSTIQ
jgi:hypothetical protein